MTPTKVLPDLVFDPTVRSCDPFEGMEGNIRQFRHGSAMFYYLTAHVKLV